MSNRPHKLLINRFHRLPDLGLCGYFTCCKIFVWAYYVIFFLTVIFWARLNPSVTLIIWSCTWDEFGPLCTFLLWLITAFLKIDHARRTATNITIWNSTEVLIPYKLKNESHIKCFVLQPHTNFSLTWYNSQAIRKMPVTTEWTEVFDYGKQQHLSKWNIKLIALIFF